MRWCGAVLSAESAVSFHFQKFIAVKIRYTLKKKKKKTAKKKKALEIVLEGERLLSVLLQLNQIVEYVYLVCKLGR